jgi:hypothetical protein
MAIKPEPGLAGYTELRRDLMHLADEENKTRLLLIDIQKQKNEAILALVNAAEKMFGKSIAEMTPDGDLKSEFKTDTDVEAVATHMQPSRRNCGLCGKPGHRAPNCPNAHEVKAAEEKAAAVPKEKKKRKPLSPERKAQLVETLKKARAARKRGKA